MLLQRNDHMCIFLVFFIVCLMNYAIVFILKFEMVVG